MPIPGRFLSQGREGKNGEQEGHRGTSESHGVNLTPRIVTKSLPEAAHIERFPQPLEVRLTRVPARGLAVMFQAEEPPETIIQPDVVLPKHHPAGIRLSRPTTVRF